MRNKVVAMQPSEEHDGKVINQAFINWRATLPQYLSRFGIKLKVMNAELIKLAMEKVGNPHILVNVLSRRVRQLNGGGRSGRPLIANTEGMRIADIALREIVEGRMGWELPEWEQVVRPLPKKRKKPEAETPRARAILYPATAVA